MIKKSILSLTCIAIAASGLYGCAGMSETQRDTGTGAAIGAVTGAVLGRATSGKGNRGEATAIGAAAGAAIGAGGGYLWSQRMQAQKAEMERATQGTGVSVSQTTDNQLKLDIPSDVSFDTGRYDIKPNMRAVLDRFASSLTQHTVTTVRIVGHTDSTGSDAVNNPLSVNRAAAVRDYLVDRGVASNRFSIDGRGSREPVADNTTAAGRAMNRRVEIFVAEAAR
ncbi:OmpA family protein [Azoarcus indigens]|uniref:Outer membrane protein OmpA-like peptidoglycan-associated protein n=1 Tax=Azoarcus indigens TaxID=29545 RepID=A0A4R6E4L1_9RHOO|nr:outer membrane protein OmpA-like peptidoglycan-associated protein [Azoarcus indigens]